MSLVKVHGFILLHLSIVFLHDINCYKNTRPRRWNLGVERHRVVPTHQPNFGDEFLQHAMRWRTVLQFRIWCLVGMRHPLTNGHVALEPVHVDVAVHAKKWRKPPPFSFDRFSGRLSISRFRSLCRLLNNKHSMALISPIFQSYPVVRLRRRRDFLDSSHFRLMIAHPKRGDKEKLLLYFYFFKYLVEFIRNEAPPATMYGVFAGLLCRRG